MTSIADNRILYNSYRFSGANTARVGVPGHNRGELTQDGRMGFDCSGFVDYVVRHSGYDIGEQYMNTEAVFNKGSTELTPAAAKWQTKVDVSNVRPGDLVYFTGHVGVVVSYDAAQDKGIFRSSTGRVSEGKGLLDSEFSVSPGKPSWGRDERFKAFTRVTVGHSSTLDKLSPKIFDKFPALVETPSLNTRSDALWFELMAKLESSRARRGKSSGYDAVNGEALGKYQMKERLALKALGYTDENGRWVGKVGAEGTHVRGREDFLKSHATQDAAAREYLMMLRRELHAKGTWGYVGKVVNGHLVTEEGLLAAAWMSGSKGALKYLSSQTGTAGKNEVDFWARIDQFRGAPVDGMTGLSLARNPHAEVQPFAIVRATPPQAMTLHQKAAPSIPDPQGNGQVTYHRDRSTTYEYTAQMDAQDGAFRRGDAVSTTYNPDGTLRVFAVWHADDGLLEARVRSENGRDEVYSVWDRQGMLRTRVETELASGRVTGELVLNGKAMLAQGATKQAVPKPEGAPPGPSESHELTQEQMGRPTFSLGSRPLPPSNASMIPSGDTGQVIASLNAQGYEVTQTPESIFANNPQAHYVYSDQNRIEIGDRQHQTRFEYTDDHIRRLVTQLTNGDKDVATFNAQTLQQESRGMIQRKGDDEAAITTTLYPDGRAHLEATDADGNVVGTTDVETLPNRLRQSQTRDAHGNLIQFEQGTAEHRMRVTQTLEGVEINMIAPAERELQPAYAR